MTDTSPPTVPVSELRVGLYVHLDLAWVDHPFASGSFKIATPQQIETIRSLGLQRLRYSPERSDPPASAASSIHEALAVTAPRLRLRNQIPQPHQPQAQKPCTQQPPRPLPPNGRNRSALPKASASASMPTAAVRSKPCSSKCKRPRNKPGRPVPRSCKAWCRN